ncbi:hypothetical protein [Anatilimnocola floriformis]|uniref:hypothetical protein n=1 Tax=Anatilimnocola floriformis TaxID=2948575 RepID=UPI0020C29333|nr:hypothetical protein [Anatilimnocola floriformis]
MTERTDNRRSAAAVATLVVLLLLPVAYVLSIGPANWLVSNEYLDSDSVRWLYLPLINLAEHSETANQVIVWYLSMFGFV